MAWLVTTDSVERSRSLACFYRLGRGKASLGQLDPFSLTSEPITLVSLYAPPPHRVTRGHPHQIMIERTRLNVYAQSYFLAVQRPWNSLPASVACAPTLDAFKQQLDDAAATSTVYERLV